MLKNEKKVPISFSNGPRVYVHKSKSKGAIHKQREIQLIVTFMFFAILVGYFKPPILNLRHVWTFPFYFLVYSLNEAKSKFNFPAKPLFGAVF